MVENTPDAQFVDELRAVEDELRAAQASQESDIRAAASVVLERMHFLRQAGITFKGARDLYDVLGYDRIITNRQYRDRYARGGIAGRVVDALPNATWRGEMWVEEDDNPENITPFEQAWDDLDVQLQVQAKLRKADILGELSTYSVLLIGATGDLSTELPRGKPGKVLYLTPFSGGGGPGGDMNSRAMALDADCTIETFDIDSQSKRFGLPLTYRLKRTDLASPELQRPVHWSRIIHIANNCIFDEVYGQPSLERVWNLLDDLDKVTGGGSEAFWLRANQGLHLNIDKDMQLPDVEASVKALKEQSEEYKHQITRWLRTRGVDVQTLGSDVANFSNPADSILTQIAGAKSIPKRILTGSEMGELASSQDRDNWKDQVNGRQTQYAGPYIVRQLVDRLVEYGYLPTPKGGPKAYEIHWPHVQTLTEQERFEGAKAWAGTNQTNGTPVFTDDEIRKKWYDLEPLTEEQKAAMVEAKKAMQPAPPPGRPGAQSAEEEKEEPLAAQEAELLHVLSAAIESNNTAVIDKILGLRHVEERLSSTQIQLPYKLSDALLALGREIDDDDLALEGRELDAHITVKYGLHTDDPKAVRDVVEDFGPVDFTLGETDYFSSPDYDVLFVSVKSECLQRLNALISQSLEVTDTHPEYKPHATIAYLKPGLGPKYAERTALVGETGTATSMIFSSSAHERSVIDLAQREEFQIA